MKLVLRRRRVVLTVLALVAGLIPATPAVAVDEATELFISEYIEGSSNNKAIEIFNGTQDSVNLGDYSIEVYFNGNSSAGLTIGLAGTVAPGDVFVLAQSSAAAEILAVADQTNGSGWFNGDDAVVLRRGTDVVDSVGQVGFDPGSQWGADLTSTQDNTLVRPAAVCAGDTNPADVFDPSVEWTGFAQDTFTNLGAHTTSCTPGPYADGADGGQPLPLSADFDDCTLSGWQIISVDADTANTWACNASFSNIDVNGFGDSAPADEWLITPPLDLDAQDDDTLTFRSWTRFTDSGIAYPQVSVLYSTDYDGGGDPTSATWTALSATLSAEDSQAWTDSGPVDLSGVSGTSVYVAFRYQSSGTGGGTAANWRLDGIEIAEALPPPPTSPCLDAPAVTLIGIVQGSGDATPCDSDTVTIEGVVVGDYEGSSPNLRGFYVQDAGDGDPTTSDGIFVFHGSVDSVNVGDTVRVTGTVSEFQGQTQLGFPADLENLGPGGTIAPTAVTLPVASADYLERYEGMLVIFEQSLYVTEFFQLGRFGQVVVSSGDRLRQPTDMVEPGAAAIALQQANNLNRLIVDDGINSQNPDPIVFGRNGDPLSADNTLRGGDTLSGAVGVMTYTWAGNSASGNAYRLRPQNADGTFVFDAANPRPSSPPEVAGDLTVASFNVLNYFVTLDDGGTDCGPFGFPQECRGAETSEEFERQREKLLAALEKLDGDVVGLVEMENTEGVEPLADIVEGLNDQMGVGTYGYVETGTVGTDVIKVGLIYKPGTVTPFGDPATLDSGVDARFDDDLNRVPVAQTFVENATGEMFTVVVNHLKSKGCGDATGLNLDQGDGQGCYNAARTAAAKALVEWMESEPTGVADTDFLVIGDLNSYAKEDPIDVFVSAGFVDLLREFDSDPYTYVFDGQWGYLDYAMASPSMAAQITGTAGYPINADEPSVLDYNTNFKSSAQITSLYAPDEFRTSDHDPVIVGIDLAGLDPEVTPSPDVLWPADRQLHEVTLSATDGLGTALDVEILEVVSSEPDAGPRLGPFSGDIEITGNDTVLLRAERYGSDGRIYTIHLVVSDESQSRLWEVTVVVPHDRNRRPR